MIASPPGFYGKVTTHGDFVTRRLPAALVAVWDDWLQQCMVASRQQLGADWLAHYLTSPVWRFVIAAGILDERAWAGVMMPSVDRVGRHFPLMLAAPAAADMPLTDWPCKAQGWYDVLEDSARSSLATGFVIEAFDQALAAQPVQADIDMRPQSGKAWRLPLVKSDRPTDGLMHALTQGHSLWWTEGGPGVEPSMLVCEGLPAPSGFAALLAGAWHAHGWADRGAG